MGALVSAWSWSLSWLSGVAAVVVSCVQGAQVRHERRNGDGDVTVRSRAEHAEALEQLREGKYGDTRARERAEGLSDGRGDARRRLALLCLGAEESESVGALVVFPPATTRDGGWARCARHARCRRRASLRVVNPRARRDESARCTCMSERVAKKQETLADARGTCDAAEWQGPIGSAHEVFEAVLV